jgi:hypothetical protein
MDKNKARKLLNNPQNIITEVSESQELDSSNSYSKKKSLTKIQSGKSHKIIELNNPKPRRVKHELKHQRRPDRQQ